MEEGKKGKKEKGKEELTRSGSEQDYISVTARSILELS